MTGLGRRAEIAPLHIRDHARTKGRNWYGLLNVYAKPLCQLRQNHVDEQHTSNTSKRETNP